MKDKQVKNILKLKETHTQQPHLFKHSNKHLLVMLLNQIIELSKWKDH